MQDLLNNFIYPALVTMVSIVFKKLFDVWSARHHNKRKDN